jgi:hypothetical protein
MVQSHDKPICMEITDKRYGWIESGGGGSTVIHQEYKRDGFNVQTKKNQIKYSVS